MAESGMNRLPEGLERDVKDIAGLLHDATTTVAVVGATDNPAKYGSVIYRDLKRKGFAVYPVNLHRDQVDGDKAYPTLADLPQPPTIVNVVVPPDQTLQVLGEALELGLTNVWLQPGAEDPAALRYLQEHDFSYLANACIMVASRVRA
jgi:hypothetical protein